MSSVSSEEQFYLALAACHTAVHRMTERVIAEHGVTVAQYNLLRVIQNTPGVTANETRERLMATAPSVAQLIAQAEEKGWIRRQSDKDDARKLRLSLSSLGTSMLAKTRAAIERNVRSLAIPAPLLRSLSRDLSSLLTSLPSYGKR